MKIAISGSGGFLGMNLIAHLLRNPRYTIYAITSNPERVKRLSCNDRLHIFSEFDKIEWNSIDILLNLAFPRNADGQQIASGLLYIKDLLTCSIDQGVKSVVNISSQSVYSQKRLASANEETELNLESSYAVGKYATELLTNSICKKKPHTSIRLASLLGPGFKQRIVNKFIKLALEKKKIKIIDGKQRFGFLDIRDAVSGLETVISSNSDMWKEVYNLGAIDSYSLEEIAELVCIKCGGTFIREPGDEWLNSSLDSSRFIEDFTWMPRFTLIDTIETIMGDIVHG